jgi:hypothetical protein
MVAAVDRVEDVRDIRLAPRAACAASMFPTSPHGLHGGEVGNKFGSATRVNSQEGGPIRKRTGGQPGTPRAPLTARFQVFPQTPIPASPARQIQLYT